MQYLASLLLLLLASLLFKCTLVTVPGLKYAFIYIIKVTCYISVMVIKAFLFYFYFAEGDWKITVVTGDFETAGTTATVSLYAYGEKKASGPIILGSGKHQLFNPNSEDAFKVQYGFYINTGEFKTYAKQLFSKLDNNDNKKDSKQYVYKRII